MANPSQSPGHPLAAAPAGLEGTPWPAVVDALRSIWRTAAEAVHDGWTWLVEGEQLVLVRLITSVLILLASAMASRLVRRHLERSAKRTAERNHLDDWQTRALVSRSRPIAMVVAITLYIVAAIFILAVWQMQTAFLSLLTAAGFAGIVIGIAASNSLSNLISGFMIFYNHPFDIGDWIEIEDVQGIVVDVKPGATVIESWDGEKITYPNRIVEGSRIKNKSHQRKFRWRFPIGVDYATDIEKARGILLKIVQSHPDVLKEPEPQVIATGYGDSSINLEVRYWVVPLRTSVLVLQTWLMEEIQRAFAKEGIVIPFPQRTVVWRYQEGNPPPGDTVSELAYDPEKDNRPFPNPPPAMGASGPASEDPDRRMQWIEKVWDRKRGLLRVPEKVSKGLPLPKRQEDQKPEGDKGREGGQGEKEQGEGPKNGEGVR